MLIIQITAGILLAGVIFIGLLIWMGRAIQ